MAKVSVSDYFQAAAEAILAFLKILPRQGFFFIPLIFILPLWYGDLGVWIAFPIPDVLSIHATAYCLQR